MKIHKEGYPTIILVLVLVAIISVAVSYVSSIPLITYGIYAALIAFFVFIVRFFRVPNRVYTTNPHAIIAPADGKIVAIEEIYEPTFLNQKCRQISIFMSPLNVHVNRYPINGTVLISKHKNGQKLPAFNPKSSELNEQTNIVLQTNNGYSILFRQVAGAVARRIVNYAKEGDMVSQNQEFGFIKFGSRVDVFIPLDLEVTVELGQITWGGQTIIAKQQ